MYAEAFYFIWEERCHSNPFDWSEPWLNVHPTNEGFLKYMYVFTNWFALPLKVLYLETFLLQCRVDSFDYVACGNSTTKKEAQANAAKDFVQYLVRVGRLAAKDIPAPPVCINPFSAGTIFIRHNLTFAADVKFWQHIKTAPALI